MIISIYVNVIVFFFSKITTWIDFPWDYSIHWHPPVIPWTYTDSSCLHADIPWWIPLNARAIPCHPHRYTQSTLSTPWNTLRNSCQSLGHPDIPYGNPWMPGLFPVIHLGKPSLPWLPPEIPWETHISPEDPLIFSDGHPWWPNLPPEIPWRSPDGLIYPLLQRTLKNYALWKIFQSALYWDQVNAFWK